MLADAATGQVLWGRGLNTERPMASVTKVMTALMVLESAPPRSENPGATGGLQLRLEIRRRDRGSLRPGDEPTVQDLLEALLLPSGADAAYTLANAYGPGLNAFIATHERHRGPDGHDPYS